MNQTIVAFILFLFTNLFCSATLMLVFNRLNKGETVNRWDALLFGLGIGPPVVTLFLYYLLWLLPDMPHWFYLVVVSAIFIVAFFLFGLKEVGKLLPENSATINLKLYVNFNWNIAGQNSWSGWRKAFSDGSIKSFYSWGGIRFTHWLFLLFILIFSMMWMRLTLKYPLVEHDILEYAVQGMIFARNLNLDYVPHRFDPVSNFYYVGLHGFSFPLLSTWQWLVNFTLGFKTDFFFRLQSGYYFILIFVQVYILARKLMKKYAIYPLLSLVVVYWFYDMLFDYHIDSYRLYLFFLAVMSIFVFLNKPSGVFLVLTSITCGLAAFAHSTAALALIFCAPVFLFYYPASFMKRIWVISLFFILVIFFGAGHYIMDTLVGTGWVFGLKETY